MSEAPVSMPNYTDYIQSFCYGRSRFFFRIALMIANFFKQLPRDAVRTGAYFALAGLVGVKVFPVLREWDVFAAFPSKAYMEREV